MPVIEICGVMGAGKGVLQANIAWAESKSWSFPDNRYHGWLEPFGQRLPKSYTVHSNFALYFCHPPTREVSGLTGAVTPRASCSCPQAQPNGDLDLFKLASKVEEDPDWLYRKAIHIHEAHRLVDSRLSMSTTGEARTIEHKLLQLFEEVRKRDCVLVMDTQGFNKIDVRIRENANMIVQCVNWNMNLWGGLPKIEYHFLQPIVSDKFVELRSWRAEQPWLEYYGQFYNTYETPTFRTEVELMAKQ